MKPNQQQDLKLRRYLSDTLRYRETYGEFYDHILAALEIMPANIDFEDVVQKVINEDFGGVEGMCAIEEKYKRLIFIELRKKYLTYALDNFKLPGLIVPVFFALVAYFTVRLPGFTFGYFLLVLFGVRIVPELLLTFWHLKLPYIYGQPKASIKKTFFKWANFIPAAIIGIWILTTPGAFTNEIWAQNMSQLAMVIVIVLVSIHSFTFYRVYRDNIKTKFTTI